MIFADLLAGEPIFVDANVLIYHFGPHPTLGAECNQLMRRIENQEVQGFTSTHVLAEMAHQLMLVEALALPGWSVGKTRQRLQKQPSILQSLTLFRQAIDSVLQSKVHVLTIAPDLFSAAAIVSQQNGLLTNDACTVAVMKANNMIRIASHDPDFDRVPGITRYTPA